MTSFFVTATGTYMGKSFVTAALCREYIAAGREVVGLKPVISGYDAGDPGNDSALLLAACGREPTAQAQAELSPWRYKAPLTPTMAAAREGHTIDMEALIAYCREPRRATVLVEGVGGIMAPLTERHTVLDWMVALGWPVLLVAGSYLGAISHTLTAIRVLQSQGLAIHTLVLNASKESSVDLHETRQTLELFLPKELSIVTLGRHQDNAAPLTHLYHLCQTPASLKA